MNAGAATDTGWIRESNEDRYWIDAEQGVFLVVDGVGGHAGGELAAETAVAAIRDALQQFTGTPEERIRQAIAHANNRIFDLAQQDGNPSGMACVLTLALLENGELTIGHVGDSRLYLVWEGAMRKMTSDHSPVGEEEEAGALTEQEAMAHPRRNEVFRDVGSRRRDAGDADFIQIRRCRFRPDAAILLCSDGLTDQLTAGEVRRIVHRYEGDAARVARELVAAANDAGGKDNATVLFIAGPEFGSAHQTVSWPAPPVTRHRGTGRLFTARPAFLAYGVLIGMLVWAVLRAVMR